MEPHLIADFTVPGRPVPKARPRVSQDRRGRNRTYTAESTVAFEGEVAKAFLVQARRRFVDPSWRFRMEVEFRFMVRTRQPILTTCSRVSLMGLMVMPGRTICR